MNGSQAGFRQFLNEVTEVRMSLGLEDGEEAFYRGHGDSTWELLPTLLRHANSQKLTDLVLRKLESDLFFEFQARARDIHDRTLDDYDVLFFMRHHGVATRLLDWTETLAVALYFALREWSAETTPCVWVLNPWRLNEHDQSWGVHELIAPEYLSADWNYSDFMNDSQDLSFDWAHPVALYPKQRNARIHAQRGYFTIHGDNRRPLNKVNKRVAKCVPLPKEAVPAALELLSISGVDDYALFPDLDGLRRSLHAKYRIDTPWLEAGERFVARRST